MKRKYIYLVENFELRTKDHYKFIRDISKDYSFSYDGMASALRNNGIYRKDGYVVTKVLVK